MITVEIDDKQVTAALAKLAKSVENTRPVLDLIGELLIVSTRQRFVTSTAPDGSRWKPNTQVTILRYLAAKSGKFSESGKRTGDKDGYLFKKGANKGRIASKGIDTVAGKRPLIGLGGDLSRQFDKKVEGNTLYIGSTMEYSAAQQFGMKRGYAGANKRGSPIPWGDIPARPFLGISDQDRVDILGTITDYLGDAFRP